MANNPGNTKGYLQHTSTSTAYKQSCFCKSGGRGSGKAAKCNAPAKGKDSGRGKTK
jgi:hypothetical protein